MHLPCLCTYCTTLSLSEHSGVCYSICLEFVTALPGTGHHPQFFLVTPGNVNLLLLGFLFCNMSYGNALPMCFTKMLGTETPRSEGAGREHRHPSDTSGSAEAENLLATALIIMDSLPSPHRDERKHLIWFPTVLDGQEKKKSMLCIRDLACSLNIPRGKVYCSEGQTADSNISKGRLRLAA